MRLKDLSQYIEIDIDEALEERFMDSEELYVRFLRKLAASNDLAVVEDFVAQQNWPEALRKAHNLKGVCGSLGLTKLQEQLAQLQQAVYKLGGADSLANLQAMLNNLHLIEY